jgi:hypothetical protein
MQDVCVYHPDSYRDHHPSDLIGILYAERKTGPDNYRDEPPSVDGQACLPF